MIDTRCIVCQTADGGFTMENVCLNCGETVAGLKAQRDALLAACRELVAANERIGGPLSVEPSMDKARATIASATPQGDHDA